MSAVEGRQVLERAPLEPCAMCETVPGRWNEPAAAADVRLARAQLRGLERRLSELARGETEPGELHRRLLHMCLMCQEIVLDAEGPNDLGAVLARLRYCIARLRVLLRAAA